ncbi:uncharacterized protein METZ01_LOCUS481236, partial [marine metagenome]
MIKEKLVNFIVISLAFVFIFHPQSVYSQSWYSCERNLKKIKREAKDGENYIQEIQNRQQQLESAQSDLDDCKSQGLYGDMGLHDLYGDNCQTLYYEYQSAKSEYDSAVSNVQHSINSLKIYMSSVETSCVDPNSWIQICGSIITMKNKRSPTELFSMCENLMSKRLCNI